MNEPNQESTSGNTPSVGGLKGLLLALGPAIIVASVVLGPGSIMTSTKVGCLNGMRLIWVTPFAGILLFAMVMLSTRLGATLKGTLCDELAANLGRPLAIFVGVVLFTVVAFFQMSNNSAILASVESFVTVSAENKLLNSILILVPFNLLIIATLYASSNLYQLVERLMKVLVSMILVAFTVNLILAKPDIMAVLNGLVVRMPEIEVGQSKSDAWFAIIGLIGTTFSVAGAFYQSYLVREKGWNHDDLKKGNFDSAVGVLILCIATMMVMVTAATQLLGKELTSLAQVAEQLEPAFGSGAIVLFSIGIFAAAFSSFLVNAMIGGTLLSDGFGMGAQMKGKWPKLFTVLALVVGMVLSLAGSAGTNTVNVIIIAQALTVLGGPVLAFSMLYLGIKNYKAAKLNFVIMKGVIIGCLVSLGIAIKTAITVYEKLNL